MTQRYFAYGSNLDATQMACRCPSAVLLGPATLHDYELAFGGWSRSWGGPVATVRPARGQSVPGLLWELSDEDLSRLDGYEGCPRAYERTRPRVLGPEGSVRAWVYPMRRFDGPRLPAPRYLELIAQAYRRLGFSAEVLKDAVRRVGEGTSGS